MCLSVIWSDVWWVPKTNGKERDNSEAGGAKRHSASLTGERWTLGRSCLSVLGTSTVYATDQLNSSHCIHIEASEDQQSVSLMHYFFLDKN